MSRYRNELDDESDYYSRRERPRGGGYGDSYPRGRSFGEDYRRSEEYRRPEYNRGRFGERAAYEYDEPRYGGTPNRYREEDYGSSHYDRGEHLRRGFRDYYSQERSRLRCHEIMTRDLAVATRDTTLRQVAIMMKEEDTGVIPVVDYEPTAGDGRTSTTDERTNDVRTYNRGKLVGLITDRDIVIRAIADDKDCASTRAEEVMSTDLYTAKPNDRLVDLIRKMGDKQVRRIPVTSDSGRLLGMISMADIARETQDDRELAQALEEISRESSFWRKVFG